MKISIISLLFLGLIVSTGSAHAQDIVPGTTTVPSVDTPTRSQQERPPLKERLRGAQDQFLQHQNQVKSRVSEFKDTVPARIEGIKAGAMERREVLKGMVSERRALQGMKPEERKEAVQAHIEERKTFLMEKRSAFASSTEEHREKFSAKHGERAVASFNHAVQLMNAMILRLSGIADRIDARVDVLAAEGVDVASAESALATARTKIDEAEAAVVSLSEALSVALASETPRESFHATRALAQTAKAAIRSAHEALRSAVQALPKPNTETGT
ncbi:MAG: hypothetical protein Q8O19_06695 [Rectinemataceae bacterium]|nr:hypothetical protein [Rectinemataceae bacterium]